MEEVDPMEVFQEMEEVAVCGSLIPAFGAVLSGVLWEGHKYT